jgi:hypothetical protein
MHERSGCAAPILAAGEGTRMKSSPVLGINTVEQLRAAERLMKKNG